MTYGFSCPKEECGIFGVYSPGEDTARITYFALYSLQHRGQESTGIAVTHKNNISIYKGLGLVAQVYNEVDLEKLKGNIAIGHNRYSTTGSNRIENVSPVLANCELGKFSIAHNGNIINAEELKNNLSKNIKYKSTTDSEVMAHLIASSKGNNFEDKIYAAMKLLKGSYSVTLLANNALYAFRDPRGFRPLSLAKINGGWAIASETCVFGTIGAKRIRDLKPGEILKIDNKGIKSKIFPSTKNSFCIFEYIYFSRPDSVISEKSVYTVRENLGRELSLEYPQKADMVIGVPDSGIPGAIGYSIESNISYREGLIKNKYIARTFIDPDQRMRELGVKIKLNALRSVITGKKVILIDDSIVRGNTTKNIVNLLKEKGAQEVHVRITSPPIKYPCFFGVDFPTYEELIASNKDVGVIKKHINADSLGYLSLNGMVKATGLAKKDFCLACFNGIYPILNHNNKGKLSLEDLNDI